MVAKRLGNRNVRNFVQELNLASYYSWSQVGGTDDASDLECPAASDVSRCRRRTLRRMLERTVKLLGNDAILSALAISFCRESHDESYAGRDTGPTVKIHSSYIPRGLGIIGGYHGCVLDP